MSSPSSFPLPTSTAVVITAFESALHGDTGEALPERRRAPTVDAATSSSEVAVDEAATSGSTPTEKTSADGGDALRLPVDS